MSKLFLFLLIVLVPSFSLYTTNGVEKIPLKVDKSIDSCEYNNYVIGDSQSPYIDWGSDTFRLISNQPGVNSLWSGGKTLSWLLAAVRLHKTDVCVKNIAISIGTNGGFNKNDSIQSLVFEIKNKFPNSNIYVVQGSWGWGGVSNKTEKQVRDYYLLFKQFGVEIIEPPIGKIEPHGKKPVYLKIGNSLDSLVKSK